MMLSLKTRMERILDGFGIKVGSFFLVYGTPMDKKRTPMEEIEAVESCLSHDRVFRPIPFRAMEADAAKAVMDERKEHSFTPEDMVKSGWSPFQEFWFKRGWSRIIFHNCKGGVRPYVCGDSIDFAGCKVCEKLIPPEVWAARELLRDWSEE